MRYKWRHEVHKLFTKLRDKDSKTDPRHNSGSLSAAFGFMEGFCTQPGQ